MPIVNERKIWITGEMEFPRGLTRREARNHLANIADSCGYCVINDDKACSLTVIGGDIPEYISLFWDTETTRDPNRIEVWACDRTWI